MSAAKAVSATLVLVLASKKTVGFPESKKKKFGSARRVSEGGVAYCPIVDALTARYKTDAHFSPYMTELPYRLRTSLFNGSADGDLVDALKKRAMSEERIAAVVASVSASMVMHVSDVDDPVAHKQRIPARAEWRAVERPKIDALRSAHPGFVVPESRGGYRPLARLPAPKILRNQFDVMLWKKYYLGVGGYLFRRFGILIDPSCKDWTRLYRLPFVVRDGKVENNPVHGDLRAIGMFEYEPTELDFAVAREFAKTDGRWSLDSDDRRWKQDGDEEEDEEDEDASDPRVYGEVSRPSLGDGLKWELAGDHVRAAIKAIASAFPPIGRRHELALALAGMLRRAGATEGDARHVLHAAFKAGGSCDPDSRAAVVAHTWALAMDAQMLGFTRACEILGEAVAKQVGDHITDARNEAFLSRLDARKSPKRATASDPGPGSVNAEVDTGTDANGMFVEQIDVCEVRTRVRDIRKRKGSSQKRDEQIDGYILEAILDGEDITPMVDGKLIEDSSGHKIDALKALDRVVRALGRGLVGVSWISVLSLAMKSFTWGTGLRPDQISAAEKTYYEEMRRSIAWKGMKQAQKLANRERVLSDFNNSLK